MPDATHPASIIAFSELEEEFFRAGERLSEGEPCEDFSDLDVGHQRPSLWRSIVDSLRAAARLAQAPAPTR